MDEFVLRVAAIAAHNALAYVRAIVDGSTVVFAVWPDRAKPEGVDMILLKGNRHLMEVMAGGGGGASTVEVNAVPCDSAQQAAAVKLAFGETELD